MNCGLCPCLSECPMYVGVQLRSRRGQNSLTQSRDTCTHTCTMHHGHGPSDTKAALGQRVFLLTFLGPFLPVIATSEGRLLPRRIPDSLDGAAGGSLADIVQIVHVSYKRQRQIRSLSLVHEIKLVSMHAVCGCWRSIGDLLACLPRVVAEMHGVAGTGLCLSWEDIPQPPMQHIMIARRTAKAPIWIVRVNHEDVAKLRPRLEHDVVGHTVPQLGRRELEVFPKRDGRWGLGRRLLLLFCGSSRLRLFR
mmetsp:Transcript_8441/g.20687  ORF Transcript_8441/g.20687 Transcript_8441/m.20687 type:complete len:250 (-) Transcript_8441:323-1072(-)